MYLKRIKITQDERFKIHKGTRSKQTSKYVSLCNKLSGISSRYQDLATIRQGGIINTKERA